MADSSFISPPLAPDKPSIWPVRNQRCRCAAAAFQNQVITTLDTITSRLRVVEDKLNAIGPIASPPGLVGDQTYAGAIQRIERLETLLVCNDKFSPSVDAVLSALISKESHKEPEKELSPIKESSLEAPTISKFETSPIPCSLNLDIYSEAEDHHSSASITETAITDNTDPISRCEELILEYKMELKTMQFAGRVKEHNEFILEKFDSVFAGCPQKSSTTLSRDDYNQKYKSIHRTPLWRKVVNKYHGRTGDPLAKSDTFLSVMHLFSDSWNESPPTDTEDD